MEILNCGVWATEWFCCDLPTVPTGFLSVSVNLIICRKIDLKIGNKYRLESLDFEKDAVSNMLFIISGKLGN